MLRPYQQELIKNLRMNLSRGRNRLVACLPTGAGKTFTFCSIIRSAIDKSSKVLILTDRGELLKQANGALDNFGLYPENIEAGKYPDLSGNLYVCMVETLNRRLSKQEYIEFLQGIDLVIIDECHMRNFTKIFPELSSDTAVLGFTATPVRQGRTKPMCDEYQAIVEGVNIGFLIDNGYLSRPHYYGIKVDLSGIKTKMGDYDQQQVADMFEEQQLYRGVVENYTRITPGKKSIVFSSNISNSQDVCAGFREHGYDARHLDSSMNKNDRAEILSWFDRSDNGILCNVGILTRGFDQPDIEVVILYRATKSLPLFLQMVGRGSRTTPTKKDFTILDFGNNINQHGYWHNDHEWSLAPPKKKTKKEDAAPIKICPECLAINPPSARTCSECGYEFKKTEEEQETAYLEKLTYSEIKKVAEKADFKTLEKIRKIKGYKKGWIYYQLKTSKDLMDYANYKGYSQKWVEHQLKLRNEN